jgi:CubicO group peptidase (beta-lactamase class C family)
MRLLRRQFKQIAGSACLLPVFPHPILAQVQPADSAPPPTPAERAAMANLADAFMRKYAVPVFSIAVGYGGAIIYQEALGWADQGNNEAVSRRICFVSPA